MDNNKPKYLKSFNIIDTIPLEYYEIKFGPWPQPNVFNMVTVESNGDDTTVE